MQDFARTLACAVLACALPIAAAAAPADDYIAARDSATAAIKAAIKAAKSDDDIVKQEEAALKDLAQRMTTLLGPVRLKGLEAPVYSIEYLLDGEDEPNVQLDGLVFSDKDETVHILVSPQPVFDRWLAARASDPDAPAALRGGLKAAAATDIFYNTSVINVGGGFSNYVELPVTAADGETVYAGLGLFSDDAPGNTAPNSVVIMRAANGQVAIGIADAGAEITSVAACDQVWKPFALKAEALRKAAEKAGGENDPRWDVLMAVEDEGALAYRTCFAREAAAQPFFAAATKRAQDLLDSARGP